MSEPPTVIVRLSISATAGSIQQTHIMSRWASPITITRSLRTNPESCPPTRMPNLSRTGAAIVDSQQFTSVASLRGKFMRENSSIRARTRRATLRSTRLRPILTSLSKNISSTFPLTRRASNRQRGSVPPRRTPHCQGCSAPPSPAWPT